MQQTNHCSRSEGLIRILGATKRSLISITSTSRRAVIAETIYVSIKLVAKRTYWTTVTTISRTLKCFLLIGFSLFFDLTIPKIEYCPKPYTTDIPTKRVTPQNETVKSLSTSARLTYYRIHYLYNYYYQKHNKKHPA
jgi:hypothetical protein